MNTRLTAFKVRFWSSGTSACTSPGWLLTVYVHLTANMHVNIKRQRGIKKTKWTWNATPPHPKTSIWEALNWRACVCEQTSCAPRSPTEKSPHWIFLRKVQKLKLSNLSFLIHSRHRGKTGRYVVKSFLLAPSLHALTHSLLPKYPEGEEGWGEDYFHFQDKNLRSQTLSSPPSVRRGSSLLSLLQLPADPLLLHPFSLPTTRWRRVFCSGNSACTTRCLLSEVLWPFQRLLGASGPTGGVIYRPSGLGTSSGSEHKKWVVC